MCKLNTFSFSIDTIKSNKKILTKLYLFMYVKLAQDRMTSKVWTWSSRSISNKPSRIVWMTPIRKNSIVRFVPRPTSWKEGWSHISTWSTILMFIDTIMWNLKDAIFAEMFIKIVIRWGCIFIWLIGKERMDRIILPPLPPILLRPHLGCRGTGITGNIGHQKLMIAKFERFFSQILDSYRGSSWKLSWFSYWIYC